MIQPVSDSRAAKNLTILLNDSAMVRTSQGNPAFFHHDGRTPVGTMTRCEEINPSESMGISMVSHIRFEFLEPNNG
jgi:hypothetical protein